MIESHTAVLERESPVADGDVTEPYEVAWAREAIVFLHAHGRAGCAARVQLSPDGMRWCDEGTQLHAGPDELAHAKVSHFGGWLRLVLRTKGEPVVSVHLALKG